MHKRRTWTLLLYLSLTCLKLSAQQPPPVVDVHLHAFGAADQGPPPIAICPSADSYPARDPAKEWPEIFLTYMKDPPCNNPIWSPTTDEELMSRTLNILRRRNVVGILSGRAERVEEWKKAAPDHIIRGFQFRLGRETISPETLSQLHREGGFSVLAEVTIQYQGISPSDERFEPYLAVAEAQDIPVGIHVGTGPPGAPYLGDPQYRARLHSPLTVEEALLKHPRLRMYLMHAGWPMLDDLLAVMWTHPQVYVGIGVLVFALPREEFYRYLERIVDAGFGKRVMFGSDQMVWPETIEHGIRLIEQAPFLSKEQKRDILYNNAARFFRFTKAEIDKHHGREE